MAKLTAWLVTILGLWLVLAQLGVIPASLLNLQGWIVALVVLVIGIGKLVRNYKLMK
ncbi:MAG: hypothetical protein PHD81_01425 [Candidatus Nanoarchaeia archaeon]|nr:hypothetical protein [Candidatus Nanoarchaeia archaeon]MDD5587749.1 hypothetical protein [Candidatus Nanoarchaeia archaeon]